MNVKGLTFFLIAPLLQSYKIEAHGTCGVSCYSAGLYLTCNCFDNCNEQRGCNAYNLADTGITDVALKVFKDVISIHNISESNINITKMEQDFAANFANEKQLFFNSIRPNECHDSNLANRSQMNLKLLVTLLLAQYYYTNSQNIECKPQIQKPKLKTQ